MAWVILFIAGVLEVVWAFLMKASEGFTRPWPTVGMVGFMIASFWLLSLSMRTLPLGTAYAIWTGIGAVGTVVVGFLLMGESPALRRLPCILLILAGVVGLKLTSTH